MTIWRPGHGAQLNFAQNLPRHRDVQPALIFRSVRNRAALANPESLDFFRDLAELQA
jgi:hypothetical protein